MPHPKPLLIDCDTGIDDILALAYLLKEDSLNILGVTTVAGNVNLDLTTYNTLNALHLMGRDELPLARGAAQPLARPLADAAYIHGGSGLGAYTFPEETTKKPVPESAWDFMAKVILQHPEPVTILALGPLTNIALLLKTRPEVFPKIKEIVFMGGSLRTGNPTPVATFNVLVDPEAAKYVIGTKIPFVMCSLDCTRGSFLTPDEIESTRAYPNPVADMVRGVTAHYIASTHKSNTMERICPGVSVHDLCTAMYLTNPELFVGEYYYADVETKGELTTGFTLVDFEDNLRKPAEDKTVFFLKKVDREAYVQKFMDQLARY